MRRIKVGVLSLILFIQLNVLYIDAANTLIYETTTKETITKGLVYEQKSKFTQNGWIDIHVLKMDMEEEQVAMTLLRDMDTFGLRHTMTGLVEKAKEDQVVAGVNASFFNMTVNQSDSIGIVYDNDDFTYASQEYNVYGHGVASLMQNQDGSIFFDFFDLTISFGTKDGHNIYLDGINKLKVTNKPVLYNSNFGTTSEHLESMGNYYKLVIVNDIVEHVAKPKEVVTIPKKGEGYIIAIPESLAEPELPFFTQGTAVGFDMRSTIDTDSLKLAISGSGKVLQNGQIVEDGYFVSKNTRQPRTAVGITGDGRYLIAMVVDGRGSSIGATNKEVGSYLLEYGVSDAIQLDGGGSSTLIARDLGYESVDVQNRPSDGGQRKVLNGIGFVSLSEPGDVAGIEINASTDKVFKNMPIDLSIIGYDENYNPVTIDPSKIVWSVDGMKGRWETNRFYPEDVGDVTITGYYEGVTASVTIESLSAPIDMQMEPRILKLGHGETGSFTINGIDASGYEGDINPKDVSYELEDTTLGTFEDGVFKAGDKSGITKVTIVMGDRKVSGYIAVGDEVAPVPGFEKVSYKERAYPEDKVEGILSVAHDVVADTDSSYRFDYSFQSSPDPQAFYMMMDNFYIEEPTQNLSLSLYGDNSGHMFKGQVVDATGQAYTITFSNNIDWTGWKTVRAEIPNGLRYPIQLERLYVVAVYSQDAYSGRIYFDALSATQSLDTSHLKFDVKSFVSDPLMVQTAPKNTTEVMLFGPTSFRNRLLDNVILANVYDTLNTADFSILAGTTDINENELTVPNLIWKDAYSEKVLDGVKFITLGTSEGGLRATDYTQYAKVDQMLRSTKENTLVFIGSKSPIKSFADDKEGKLVHKLLADYVELTEKTVIYINAGGYETDVTLKDGVRYIDLSGLWYQVSDRYVDLNTTFYQCRMFLHNGSLKYMIEPMYPAVESQ